MKAADILLILILY